jgi:hypothetical protein
MRAPDAKIPTGGKRDLDHIVLDADDGHGLGEIHKLELVVGVTHGDRGFDNPVLGVTFLLVVTWKC